MKKKSGSTFLDGIDDEKNEPVYDIDVNVPEENETTDKEEYFDEPQDGEPEFHERDDRDLPKSQSRKALERVPKHVLVWRMIKPFVAIAIGIAVVFVGLSVAWNHVDASYIKPVNANDHSTRTVTINKGSSLTELSKILEDNGIIKSATVFKYYVDFTDNATSLIAGQYQLSPSMTYDDIIDVLKRPTDITTVKMLTFTEGMNVENIANVVVKEGIIKNSSTFLRLAKSGTSYSKYSFIKDVLDSPTVGERKYVLEGYLAPDTYQVYTTSDENAIITKLLDQFEKVFSDEYVNRAKELGMTVDQVVTLASMIEKEAKTKDFEKVSAVFHNRLKENMTLGSCATQQYFMNERKLTWTKDELNIDSPYNTYKNKGLPVGPICNPSKAAIKAALYPDESFMKEGYMYFCLANPETGETVFAKTLKEQNANQAKYEKLYEEYNKKIAGEGN